MEGRLIVEIIGYKNDRVTLTTYRVHSGNQLERLKWPFLGRIWGGPDFFQEEGGNILLTPGWGPELILILQ